MKTLFYLKGPPSNFKSDQSIFKGRVPHRLIAANLMLLAFWSAERMSDDWSDYDWPDEQTDNPLRADDRNFYKVEKWSKDGLKIERMLYAGNNLDRAKEVFGKAVKHRPRIRLTIRQRTRVLDQWPRQA